MSKSIKLLINDLVLKDGLIYKKNKIFYSLKKDYLQHRFSVIILSARGFNFENIKKIVEIFSFSLITEYIFVVGNENDKNIILENFKSLNGKVIINPEPSDVIYSSLKIGLKAVSRRANFIILQFSSSYKIKKETVKTLIDRSKISKKDIIIPTYNEKKGHPIIFNSKLIPLFITLRKEKGLPYLLRNYKNCIDLVETDDENILRWR